MASNTSNKHPLYFEAILQLRDVSDKVITYTEDQFHIVGLNVAKTEFHDNGIDYYLSDMRLTRQLGKRLQDTFGGDFKVTASLFGRKKDKNLYRLTILFREIPYRKHDVVRYKGDEHKILLVSDKIVLQNVQTGKRVQLKYKDAAALRKVDMAA